MIDLNVARELYKQASSLVSVPFDQFLDILETFIENDSDMVEAVQVCKDRFGDVYACVVLGGMYLGYKLNECLVTRDCTVKVVKTK